MLYRMLPASFQNVIKTNNVTLDIHIRVVDGVADASLRGKINNNIELQKNKIQLYCNTSGLVME